MSLLPTAVGTRPRLACEIRPGSLVLARGESPSGTLTAVAHTPLAPGLVLPGLKPGNLPNRPALVAALRRALDAFAVRGADRSRYLTLILPDSCVRVLLLDFDTLPSKLADALPIVRFRLKKLLPFDVDHALVSFQIMSSERNLLRVLAVAIPQEVLAEYEAAITEAGMQPGAVLPSTLATLAGLDPAFPTALVLNTSATSFTTAIVRSGLLLLHRTIELFPAESIDADPSALPSAAIATSLLSDELFAAPAASFRAEPSAADATDHIAGHGTGRFAGEDHGSVPAFPPPLDLQSTVALLNTAPDLGNRARDLAESVSIASAYFEDTLGTAPDLLFSAGDSSARDLQTSLAVDSNLGIGVRELLEAEAFAAGASTTTIPPGLLAGVRGALRS